MSIFNSQRSSEMYLESVSSWREGMKPAERDRDKGKERSSRAFFFFFPVLFLLQVRCIPTLRFLKTSIALDSIFCLRNLDPVSVTYNHISLTYPPGLAFNTQFLCLALGQL